MKDEFVSWAVFDEGARSYLLGMPRVRLDNPIYDRPRHAKLLVPLNIPNEVTLVRFICSLSWNLVELWEVEKKEF